METNPALIIIVASVLVIGIAGFFLAQAVWNIPSPTPPAPPVVPPIVMIDPIYPNLPNSIACPTLSDLPCPQIAGRSLPSLVGNGSTLQAAAQVAIALCASTYDVCVLSETSEKENNQSACTQTGCTFSNQRNNSPCEIAYCSSVQNLGNEVKTCTFTFSNSGLVAGNNSIPTQAGTGECVTVPQNPRTGIVPAGISWKCGAAGNYNETAYACE